MQPLSNLLKAAFLIETSVLLRKILKNIRFTTENAQKKNKKDEFSNLIMIPSHDSAKTSVLLRKRLKKHPFYYGKRSQNILLTTENTKCFNLPISILLSYDSNS